jgi:phage gpG-like protein
MVTLYIKEEGQDAVMNVIADMAARGVNTRPLMGVIGNIILGSVTKNFESEGRPRWQPISSLTQDIYSGRLLDRLEQSRGYRKLKREKTRQAYRSSYISRSGGRRILQGEGDLRKSIVVGKVTRNSVEVGSSLPYARIHQLGGEIKPKKSKYLMIPMGGGYIRLKKATIPARPYLLLQKEDETTIIRATKDYLQQAALHARKGNRYWR